MTKEDEAPSGCWRALADGTAWAVFIVQFTTITTKEDGAMRTMRNDDNHVYETPPEVKFGLVRVMRSSIRHIAVAPLFGWAFGVCKAIFSGPGVLCD